MPNNITSMLIRIGDPDGPVKRLKGRTAWALANLIEAGEHGCTPLEHVGPRWSDYIFKLKKQGIAVETVHERHRGPYAGRHGRYILRSHVEVIDQEVATNG